MRPESDSVTARLVYWGAPGAGVSSNLRSIFGKLKEGSRGELRAIPTRLDPTVSYEMLPISLGRVNGVQTRLELVAVPAAPDQAPTRKQLLDSVDGIVFVADAREGQSEANLAALDELRDFLADYGRTLDELPLVIQYNKSDLSDPYAIESLHRDLGLADCAVFEAVASEGNGVLPTLTTVSKRVIRTLSEQGPDRELPPLPEPDARPEHAEAEAETALPDSDDQGADALSEPTDEFDVEFDDELDPLDEPDERAEERLDLEPLDELEDPQDDDLDDHLDDHLDDDLGDDLYDEADDQASASDPISMMEAAIIAEGVALDQTESLSPEEYADLPEPPRKPAASARIGADLRIVSLGQATRSGERGVRLPLVLGNDEGETVTLALTLRLDALLDEPEQD